MVRKHIVLLALSSLMFAVFAGAEPLPGATQLLLEDVNLALKGHIATIEVAGLEPIYGARKISMGPSQTTWRVAGQQQQIATTMITRITVERRSRVLKGMRRGLLIGAGLGAIGGGYSEMDGFFFKSVDASDIATAALAGAVIGSASGAIAGENVVFDASSEETVDVVPNVTLN